MRRPVLPKDEAVKSEWIDWQKVAQKTAIVSGAFSLILFILLVFNHINLNQDDPLQSTQLEMLKEQLRSDPNNDDQKLLIRDVDHSLRQQFFSRYNKQNQGGVVLTIALAIFFLSLRIAWINKPLPPEPGPDPHKAEEHRRELRLGRRAVWVLVVFLSFSAFTLAATVKNDPPGFVDPEAALKPIGPVIPSYDELLAQWPSFRGMGANARVSVPTWAQEWTVQSARWHEKLALEGLNSPVIWNDRLFVTGAIKAQRYVYCLNIKTGKTMWRKQVKDVEFSPEEHPHVEEDFTGYAAPTAATDGNNVYAVFANGDMVAFNFDGELQWSLNVGIEGNMYGYSASLALYDRFVYVQVDQDEGSYVTALDTMTGKAIWDKERDMGGSWGSPSIAVLNGKPQLVCMGNPHVISYDALTGEILWQHELMSGDVAPTPISVNDVVYVVNMACPLAAIDAAGEILWQNTDGGWPDTGSPVSNGTYIWLLDSSGIFTCVACDSGKLIYEEQLEGSFICSPTLVNDELLIYAEDGRVFVVATGDTYELKRSFQSGIPMKAAPAFDKKGNMYLRSGKDVYSIGVPK